VDWHFDGADVTTSTAVMLHIFPLYTVCLIP
jgi:hypothetical protein